MIGSPGKRAVLVAAAVVAVAVSLLLGLRSPAPPSGSGQPEGAHYHCGRCNGQFSLAPADLPAEALQAAGGGQEMPPRAACPDCGAGVWAEKMVQCPACPRRFVPRVSLPPGAGPDERPRDLCPHCGVDRLAWQREHRPR